jgi:ribonucleotide monophosphatase NagD (HAD superfamily)
MRARGLTMLCANPDLVVHRGERLVYCAGSLAEAYEKLGGKVIYYGKPHLPVYESALAQLTALLGHAPKRPLAVGDGLLTDIKGAMKQVWTLCLSRMGFMAKLRLIPGQHLAALFARFGATAGSATRNWPVPPGGR